MGSRRAVRCSFGSGTGDTGVGEHAQVERPDSGGSGGPEVACGAYVPGGLDVGHVGDLAEVFEGLVSSAADVGVAEVGGQVAGVAEADQPTPSLHASVVVIGPPLVHVQPSPRTSGPGTRCTPRTGGLRVR